MSSFSFASITLALVLAYSGAAKIAAIDDVADGIVGVYPRARLTKAQAKTVAILLAGVEMGVAALLIFRSELAAALFLALSPILLMHLIRTDERNPGARQRGELRCSCVGGEATTDDFSYLRLAACIGLSATILLSSSSSANIALPLTIETLLLMLLATGSAVAVLALGELGEVVDR